LPAAVEYAVGYLFMPQDPNWRQIIRDIYAEVIAREKLALLGWRDVPTDNSTLGQSVVADRAEAHAGVHRPRQKEDIGG
jgi:glutamate synthase (NADPH/NADH) large chain